MHIWVKYEDSMIYHVGRRGKYRKMKNGCHFTNIEQIDSIFHVHVLTTYVHVCGRFQMIKFVPRRAVHRQCTNNNAGNTPGTIHYGIDSFDINTKRANKNRMQCLDN